MLDTTNFLDEIMRSKRARVASARAERPLEALREEAQRVRGSMQPHALRTALTRDESIHLIAEYKRASPSKGTIRNDIAPAEIARMYNAGGATAISVLTEEDYFRGSLDDLRAVRAEVALPVLRKDFIFSEYQIYEAAALGADALLLIVAALDSVELARLRRITEDDLDMDALVEVHDAEEMLRARACSANLIGVNNRNLRTFDVSLETSIALAEKAPQGVTLISESGLSTASDLRRLRTLGYKGFLIGETLMRAEQPGKALQALLEEAEGV